MSESEVDYSNTIIYKITCKNLDITDKYVGHTIDFAKRKYAHKNNTNNVKSPCYNLKLYKFIRDNGGWDNWKMDIVNFYDCKNLHEAKVKEQEHYIELNATLNSIEPLKPKRVVNDKETPITKTIKSKYYCDDCNIACSNLLNLNQHLNSKTHVVQLIKCSAELKRTVMEQTKINIDRVNKMISVNNIHLAIYKVLEDSKTLLYEY